MKEENNKLKEIEEIIEKEEEKLREELIKQQEKSEKEKEEREKFLSAWVPKTKLGKDVLAGKYKSLNEILEKGLKIMEPEIVDYFGGFQVDILNIGQAKGKFGGGKRRAWRQTQKKTEEGNKITFSVMVVVGDQDGHVGIGLGEASETLPAREKAIRKAKLNLIKVKRGCASFDCGCSELHSVPAKTEGKTGSYRIVLMPAPRGTGLVAGDEVKKILRLAGIKDIYTRSFGKSRTTINVALAVIQALEKLNYLKTN
ncbi:MAG: 30S ribosomal protein S5 [Candidatus Pacearchaeota archaeon]